MSGGKITGDEFAQFRKTFFDECDELLTNLDERLSCLQEETADSEALNSIFRAVHSIKAGAGAFNYARLVAFSHKYEALLDLLREGRIEQSERVITALVNAGDILAVLVEAAQMEQDLADDYGADVLDELEQIMEEDGGVEGASAGDQDQAEVEVSNGDDGPSRFRISFKPHAELFRHANEPLLLVRELKTLGDLTITCDLSGLPPLRSLEPEDAYLSWTFELATGKSRDDIAEVFEFVEDDCDLEITRLDTAPVSGDQEKGSPNEAEAPVEASDAAASSAQKTSAVAEQASPKPTAKVVPAPQNTKGPASGTTGVTSIRVDLDRVDRLVNVVGELVITQSMLAQEAAERNEAGGLQAAQGHEEMATLIRELQECVMAIRMQPVKSVFARMPRLVREVSAKVGKQVRLLTTGEQTEVDKTVIEELADPLTHMIRNAIDHGLEDGETRKERGKAPVGTIKLAAKHAGGNILIQVTDDGAGIDRRKLFDKAVEKGIVAADAKLGDDEIDDLIFAPGFSTAKAVTDVSGRGVGMDVVRRNINNLGGRISVQSVLGKGTRFTLTIPLTLAVLDGMMVAVGREKYILPLTSIVESFQPERGQVRALAGGGEVVSIRGEFIRLIYLHRLFNVPGAITEPWNGLVVLLETANGGKIGVVVDELIGQQQVVIKSLQENFDPVPGVSGATILGNGKVALILDIEQLRNMPGRSDGSRPNGKHHIPETSSHAPDAPPNDGQPAAMAQTG
ncbi:chemotaxis protein CheA [uncultured Roseibium sp.]|uniref:chemotaxis protein CheA n=1 Tax=uncultured Roseibium sp. TaxID=1936171 RepID=UPI0032164F88